MTDRLSLLAAALAAGIAAAEWTASPIFAPWWAVAATSLAAAAVVRRRQRPVMAALALAAFAIGAGWYVLRRHHVLPDDLAGRLGDTPVLVRLAGTTQDTPTLRDPVAGSMAEFDHRPPYTYFAMRVDTLIDRHGSALPARGTVLVRSIETLSPFRVGDRVEVTGLLRAPRPPANPGELDYQRLARARGRAGYVDVARRELVVVVRQRAGPGTAWRRWRAAAQRHADAWLMADLPASATGRRDALLAALLLGQRGPQLDGLDDRFRDAGLAHVMAISGLHVGVLAGFVLVAARIAGLPGHAHGWLVIGVVACYLLVVDVRLPVLRAGFMTIAASAGLVARRRLRVGPLVAASAIAVLWWRPDELFGPGFQLSYGVVLGLVHLAPRVRRRLFGLPDLLAPSTGPMIGQWLRTTAAASLTAWAVATPIALYHWGVFWPLAAPFSVVVVPLVAVVLAIGFVKVVLAATLPSGAVLLALPLSFAADVLVTLVLTLESLPATSVRLAWVPAWWSGATLLWITTWVVTGERHFGFWCTRRARRGLAVAGVVLAMIAVWPLRPAVLRAGDPALRVDMLAVGDGTCLLIRSGGHAVVFDAGSAAIPDAGRRVILPALDRLGVRSLDAIVISHANLDHYGAVIELADHYDVKEVLATPQLERASRRDPAGPVMHLLDELGTRLVPVRLVAAGTTRRWGEARWRWLHPRASADFPSVNDASTVIAVETAGRRLLLCGDVQRDGLAAIGRPPTADVVELPHHGSRSGPSHAGIGLVTAASPTIVLQSTGRRRWAATRDAWVATLPGVEMLSTARDGACTVKIDRDGSIRVDRFRGD